MTSASAAPASTALTGWRVLVPRAGELGTRIAAAVERLGGVPVVSPVITFDQCSNEARLVEAFQHLAAGHFDWVIVTSATTVDVLTERKVAIPAGTRVAAVGVATGSALLANGYAVDFVPEADHSAAGLVHQWPENAGTVLIPQSEIAGPELAQGLRERGISVETVAAYRTVEVALTDEVAVDVASARIRALLLTSGSVAHAIHSQLAPLPPTTVVACIGSRTAQVARELGLPVHVISDTHSAEALVAALADYARTHDTQGHRS
jgi:uroporphyrinogen-III synthase